MILFPNAKINIGLNIIARRRDGYHDIESVMYPVGLKDILEFVSDKSSADCDFQNSGIKVNSNPGDNLVLKAFYALKERYNLPPVKIHLHKNIPIGAGLGGGSSDASFMLKGLNEAFELNLSNEQLEKISGTLGSDCPYFIRNRPAFASGRGNELLPANISLEGYFQVIVYPGIHIATSEAYSQIVTQKPEVPVPEAIKLPMIDWKDAIKNDFEKNIFARYPEIETIKQELYKLGAIYASMSGSGSAVFGIFYSIPNLKNQFKDCFVWSGILE